MPPFWHWVILRAMAAVQCRRQLKEKCDEAVDSASWWAVASRAFCCHRMLKKEAGVASLPTTCFWHGWWCSLAHQNSASLAFPAHTKMQLPGPERSPCTRPLYSSLNCTKGCCRKSCSCLAFQQDSCPVSVRKAQCPTCLSSSWSLLEKPAWLPGASVLTGCRPDSNLAPYQMLCVEENTKNTPEQAKRKEIMRVKNRAFSGTGCVQLQKLYLHFSFQLSKSARKFWESGRVLWHAHKELFLGRKNVIGFATISRALLLTSAHAQCFLK